MGLMTDCSLPGSLQALTVFVCLVAESVVQLSLRWTKRPLPSQYLLTCIGSTGAVCGLTYTMFPACSYKPGMLNLLIDFMGSLSLLLAGAPLSVLLRLLS